MNLPNQLTVARLVLTLVFVGLLSIEGADFAGGFAKTAALLVFAVAAATDFLDGYLARKHGMITTFGKLMDPLADKVLMCAGFVLLTRLELIPAWVVILILSREFLVTGLRLLASAEGVVLAAENVGKYKTIAQIVTILYFLVFLASQEPALGWLKPLFSASYLGPEHLGVLLVGLSLVLTLWSGLSYVWKNRQLLRDC
ncbi:MAG: CDP-diacylglycerol--glycerol-3-phosphate 3-phosphatidyltransferase [Verrucomicrobiales bacterium]